MYSQRKIVSLIILLICVCISAYVIFVAIPAAAVRRSYEGARKIGNDIKKAFNFIPEVTVNNIVVLQQQTPILELATLSQNFNHRYEWINQWLGSTKKISITGTFEAKAGYDLHKKFSITVSDDQATVFLPAPRLLSLESKGDIRFEDENGVWNWVRPEDRSAAVNAFNRDARRFAENAGYLKDVKTKTEEQLRKIIEHHGKTVEFRYTESLSRDL